MRNFPIIVLIAFLPACSSVPIVTEAQPANVRYVHVVLDDVTKIDELSRRAFVSGIAHQNGRIVFPREHGDTIYPVPILTNFYIRPGRYEINYGCEGIKTEISISTIITFKSNKSYNLRCAKKTADLLVN